jgi:MarR family transcriptional regulator, organic hydroperoxide resistance regulator
LTKGYYSLEYCWTLCYYGDTMYWNEHESTWAELSLTSSVLRKAWEMELAALGLTVPQVIVLELLASSKEPVNPGKLAQFMYRKPHTISALLGRMEDQGLIKRRRDLEKENTVRVTLTKKGKEALERQRNARSVRNITACLSREELLALHEINRKLHAKGIDLMQRLASAAPASAE